MTGTRAKQFFTDYRTTFTVWLLLGVISGLIKVHRGYNNFLIYKYVFWNALEENDLYQHYPDKFQDLNHYGPFFSIVIAPFAIMPEWLGVVLWNVTLAMLLYVAVRTSRFSRYEILFMLWYAAHDLLTCLFMTQFNIAVAALILLSFTMTEQKKDFWAAFFICFGVFVKLLGIVGLAFFFFSHNKKKFILSLCFWSVIMFVLPMLLSSPEYIFGQYASWYEALLSKNITNSDSRLTMNNISLIGMVRRILIDYPYSDLWVIIPGLAVVAAGYFRISQWASDAFRKMVLAQMMLITILFSTGTENSSYVIAYIAIAIWYASVPWQRSRLDLVLLVYALIFGSLLPTDLFPKSLQTSIIRPYALRALPVVLIWMKLSWEMITVNYIQKQQCIYQS
ncbi:MAG: DUF2029 domain-containing protein [Prevotella sp.]|nr:DUF2029 domain-containing protein [Prevotella sp.]